MSFEYTTSVVYGFPLKITRKNLLLLQEFFFAEVPEFDEEYYEEASEEYLRESIYALAEHELPVSINVYFSEGAQETGRTMVISEKDIGWSNISKYDWLEIAPSLLPEVEPSVPLQELATLFHVDKTGWMIFTEVS